MKTKQITAIIGSFIAVAFIGGSAGADIISDPVPAEVRQVECGVTDLDSGLTDCTIVTVESEPGQESAPSLTVRAVECGETDTASGVTNCQYQTVESQPPQAAPRIAAVQPGGTGAGSCGLTDQQSGLTDCSFSAAASGGSGLAAPTDRGDPAIDEAFRRLVERHIAKVEASN